MRMAKRKSHSFKWTIIVQFYFRIFETIVKYCYDYGTLIPLSFVLGFYVSVVMTRWWNQYTAIPFPDPLAVFVSATVHGQVGGSISLK